MHAAGKFGLVLRASLPICVVLISSFIILACGSEDVEKIKPESTGSVPGNFVVRIAPAFRNGLDSVKSTLTSVFPGSDFLARFSGDDSSLGLTGSDAKLSDLYSFKVPDTGSESINQEIFQTLQGLSDSGGKFFDQVDTDKYISGEVYDPDSVNDPDVSKQYYLDMIRWKEAISGLTDTQINAGAPVVIAVMDTGIQYDHEDLIDVIWKDSDGSIKGYDALNDRETTTPSDGNGHGTHVAGIIGGTGNNGKGIHGIGFLPQDNATSITELMSVKVLNDSGAGTSEYMTRGLKWAVNKHLAQQKTRTTQKLIINMSLGGPFESDGYDFETGDDGHPVISDDVFEYAHTNGALIIVAAGNESCHISQSCKVYGKRYKKTYYYPCSYQHVLCVAASTHEDKLAGFSNRTASVGLVAPGWQIRSAVPSSVSSESYAYFNGTSQATPGTAGAAAIVWSMYPSFSADDIKLILQKSSARISNITGEVESGYGRLDLKQALDYAAELTTAGKSPSELEATTSDTAITKDQPQAEGDPNATSSKVDGETASEPRCGVVGNRSKAGLLLWLVALLPLGVLTRLRLRF